METIDNLPPEARFLLRALHAGLTLAEAGGLIALDETGAAKRVRRAMATARLDAPAAAAGTTALVAAAAPLVEAAGRPPVRAPATPCLPHAVAGSLATGELAGPLLLATAEHVADCPSCLERVLTMRRDGTTEPTVAPPRRTSRSVRVAVVTVVVVLAAVALLLLLA